jgi:hypothetical protein
MLLFKKKFLDAIRCGRKTQTIRLWKYRRMKAGQRSYIPGVGYIRVTAVEEVSLDDLTDADAVPDGFATAAELRAELRAIYEGRGEEGSGARNQGPGEEIANCKLPSSLLTVHSPLPTLFPIRASASPREPQSPEISEKKPKMRAFRVVFELI